MESKTNCPCELGSNVCFVEETLIEEKPFESFMCFSCGMTSNSYMAIDSEHLEKATENNTQLMNDLKIVDEKRGLVWFPSVVNMGERGIIYPDGKANDWYWNYAKVVEVPEEEREQYDGHDKKLDIENPEVFGQFEFLDACKAMGIMVDEDNKVTL